MATKSESEGPGEAARAKSGSDPSGQTPKRDAAGRFMPGTAANPAGRPLGEPNKVTALVREDFLASAREFKGQFVDPITGETVIVEGLRGFMLKLMHEKPETYIGALTRIVPREIYEHSRSSLTLGLVTPEFLELMNRRALETAELERISREALTIYPRGDSPPDP